MGKKCSFNNNNNVWASKDNNDDDDNGKDIHKYLSWLVSSSVMKTHLEGWYLLLRKCSDKIKKIFFKVILTCKFSENKKF